MSKKKAHKTTRKPVKKSAHASHKKSVVKKPKQRLPARDVELAAKLPVKKAAKLPLTVKVKPAEPVKPPLIKHRLRLWVKPQWPTVFAVTAVIILTASTIVWSYLGALINQGNADQLVNSYLFENAKTFQDAVFPAQHSFLLKWPLFWLIRYFQFSDGAFIIITILTVLATVAALVWTIHKLERRPLYFGTICLALASVMLLVPAQPYAGGLLPVNMAMTTTRNLEYVLYIAVLACVGRWYSLKSWRFWAAVAGLTILVASDKLFASLAIGGGIVAAAVYWLTKRKQMLKRAGPWLLAAVVSSLLASGLLSLLNNLGITHILSTPGAAPYTVSLKLHNLVLGIFYAVAGIFTNLGGNPAFDATTLGNIPRVAYKHLYSPAGLAYAVNAVIAIAGLVAATRISCRVFGFWVSNKSAKHHKQPHRHEQDLGRAYFVSMALIWSSLAASAAFIITDHAYVVDARYVSIWFFTLFICLAAYSRSRTWSMPRIAAVAGVLCVTIIGGTWGAFQNYYSEKNAMSDIATRNHDVAQVLQQRNTSLLVGDYWRVLPIKSAVTRPITTVPLAGCTQQRNVLTSKVWQPDLRKHPFAYLLTLDKGLTDFPSCTLQEVIKIYGQPSSTVVTSGKLTSPKEIVLFYDHGIGRMPKHKDDLTRAVTNILPVSLDKLPERQTKCNGRPTIMNIVAHEDDDLLFMNPDLGRDVTAGRCIRTVYLTAGDAGSDSFYWIGREHGSEAAYSVMDGPNPDAWMQRSVDIGSDGQHQYVTIASPRQNYDISLVFLHLPDGGLGGAGFHRSSNVSLEQLYNGATPHLQTVDGESTYTSDNLVQAITALMRAFQPTEIRTQADDTSETYPDHSDHKATSRFVTQAKQQYTTDADTPLVYYMGYPVRDYDENVSDNELQQKLAAFFAYAKSDPGVCQSIEGCSSVPTYYSYLHRQYKYFP